jgi:hypothetical protein
VEAGAEPPAELLELLGQRLGSADVARRMRRRFVDTRRPILDGQVEQVRTLDSLAAGTELERRPTVLFDLEGTTLSFEGKHLRFPEHVREELGAIAAADGPFTADGLPGELDEAGRLVLVRRLIREGFLRRNGGGA